MPSTAYPEALYRESAHSTCVQTVGSIFVILAASQFHQQNACPRKEDLPTEAIPEPPCLPPPTPPPQYDGMLYLQKGLRGLLCVPRSRLPLFPLHSPLLSSLFLQQPQAPGFRPPALVICNGSSLNCYRQIANPKTVLEVSGNAVRTTRRRGGGAVSQG